jgi:hypothetical protein
LSAAAAMMTAATAFMMIVREFEKKEKDVD